MRIQKTFQGEIPANKIVNVNTSSQTDAYSCTYINDAFNDIDITQLETITVTDSLVLLQGNTMVQKDVNYPIGYDYSNSRVISYSYGLSSGLTTSRTHSNRMAVAESHSITVGDTLVVTYETTNAAAADTTIYVEIVLAYINTGADKVGDLTDLDTTDKTNVVNAINETFNSISLSSHSVFGNNDFTVSGCTLVGTNDNEIIVDTNSDKSFVRIYGHLAVTPSANQPQISLPAGTLNTRSAALTINPVGFLNCEDTNRTVSSVSYIFNTDGSVTIKGVYAVINATCYMQFFPAFLQIK